MRVQGAKGRQEVETLTPFPYLIINIFNGLVRCVSEAEVNYREMRINLIAFIIIALFCFPISSLSQNRIVVSKQKRELYVLSKTNDTLVVMGCGIGLNAGNKVRTGDKRTPEGTFRISRIQDSRHWTHDFKDGHGQRKGAYGPWFIRLRVPGFSGIGIHGTCFPNSIGTRCSDGCIRLLNKDVVRLLRYIKVGDKVTIEADK